MRRWHAAVAAVAAATSATASGAAAQATDGDCGGVGIEDKIEVARIARSAGKTHFVRNRADDKACPSLAAACRERAWLTPGDVVLTAERHGDLVCATFADRRGRETSGWLPASALQPVATKAAEPLSAWHGRWRRIEADIRIRPAAGGRLSVEGEATWGAHDKRRVASGGVNMGEITGTAGVVDGVLFFSDPPAASFAAAASSNGCAVRMRRVASYLLVEDNRSCGGMNVSFTGIYVPRR